MMIRYAFLAFAYLTIGVVGDTKAASLVSVITSHLAMNNEPKFQKKPSSTRPNVVLERKGNLPVSVTTVGRGIALPRVLCELHKAPVVRVEKCGYGLAVNGSCVKKLVPVQTCQTCQTKTSKGEAHDNAPIYSSDCVELTQYFEHKYGIPNGLLLAIANVESTKRPWAVNNFKESRYFKSQNEAIQYIRTLKESEQSSISVGFMQVNWMVHKNNFNSLEEAFTPFHNIEFAAKLLVSLHLRFGSWERAVMWYNPRGSQPNYEYLRKVSAHCSIKNL
jgi:hypothetical protein